MTIVSVDSCYFTKVHCADIKPNPNCISDDHLDYNTIMELYRTNSEHIHFFVPLGESSDILRSTTVLAADLRTLSCRCQKVVHLVQDPGTPSRRARLASRSLGQDPPKRILLLGQWLSSTSEHGHRI